MGVHAISLEGQRFNMLVVTKRAPNQGNKVMWQCKCDCGNDYIVSASSLKMNKTYSCGCERRISVNDTRTHTNVQDFMCEIKTCRKRTKAVRYISGAKGTKIVCVPCYEEHMSMVRSKREGNEVYEEKLRAHMGLSYDYGR